MGKGGRHAHPQRDLTAIVPRRRLAPLRGGSARFPASNSPSIAPAPESTVTAEQAVVVDPMALLDPADRPIAEKIRDLFAAPSDRIFGNKKERAAAEAFYQSRNYLPLWLDKGLENARATSAIARLKNADSDGLEASDYKTPNFAGLTGDTLAEADLKLTQAVLTYARHVQAGRFLLTPLRRHNQPPPAPPAPPKVPSQP